MKYVKSGILVAVFITGLVGLNACQKSAPSTDASESKSYLRAGLTALDQSNDTLAESDLKLSLEADPSNTNARVALASLYAKQAGVNLKDWLDPFWEAGREIAGKLKEYKNSSDLIDDVTNQVQSIQPSDKSSLTQKEKDKQKRVTDLLNAGTHFTLAASVAMDIFHSMPDLTDDQMTKLDKAIDELREQNLASPSARTEDVRVYQSILSFVRLINHFRRTLGDENTDRISLRNKKVCSMEAAPLKGHLHQIQISLERLEEGLVVSPSDPDTSQRLARQKMNTFVTDFLDNPAWDEVDSLFDADTLEGQAAQSIASYVCKAEDAETKAVAVENVVTSESSSLIGGQNPAPSVDSSH